MPSSILKKALEGDKHALMNVATSIVHHDIQGSSLAFIHNNANKSENHLYLHALSQLENPQEEKYGLKTLKRLSQEGKGHSFACISYASYLNKIKPTITLPHISVIISSNQLSRYNGELTNHENIDHLLSLQKSLTGSAFRRVMIENLKQRLGSQNKVNAEDEISNLKNQLDEWVDARNSNKETSQEILAIINRAITLGNPYAELEKYLYCAEIQLVPDLLLTDIIPKVYHQAHQLIDGLIDTHIDKEIQQCTSGKDYLRWANWYPVTIAG